MERKAGQQPCFPSIVALWPYQGKCKICMENIGFTEGLRPMEFELLEAEEFFVPDSGD
jgi:hypothetical protein